MSKALESYYDWELGFKGKTQITTETDKTNDDVNSLGIPKTKFKSFLAEWKEKNL